ncbi:MAG: AlkA N-terminal domain-containing protein [Exilibacterium sp.]
MQSLPIEMYERARRSRDPRFDGRFFTGVMSTGIYCRPICPAPAAKAKNVIYFPSAAAAAQAGLRPCLRCRPESAPESAAWLGAEACIRRAMRLILDGGLDHHVTGALAGRLGISERHLRRLFSRYVGASPQEVVANQRLLFARKLLRETNLPITELALSAGFSSIRQFNHVFRKSCDMSPGEYRRAQQIACGHQALRLQLNYRPPYDWSGVLAFFRQRAIPGVESVSADSYRRLVEFAGNVGLITVVNNPGKNCLSLEVNGIDSRFLPQVVNRVRCLFDLDASPDAVTGVLATEPMLSAAVRANPGLRLPGAWEPFELAVRAVLGQQVSVKAARTFAGRLVTRCGLEWRCAAQDETGQQSGEPLRYAFPDAQRLLSANLDGIGLTGRRIDTLKHLATAILEGELTLTRGIELESCIKNLLALPGIGAWTAQYIAMRALSEPDAFPDGDLGLIKAAQSHSPTMTCTELTQRAEHWRPWRAYAAIYLWRTLE